MKLLRSQPWYSQGNSQRIVAVAFVAIAAIATADSVVIPYIGLAFLYLIPLVMASAFLSRWQIVVIAFICTAFSDGFSKLPDGGERVARAVFMLVTYLSVSLIIRELVVYRRAATRRLDELETDLVHSHSAEQEMELLMNSTAVGIITVSADGNIVKSNRAAHDILGVGPGGLTGRPISQFLTVDLKGRTSEPIDCTGRKANGVAFSARVFTSTFSLDGMNMAGIVIEASPQQSESGAAHS